MTDSSSEASEDDPPAPEQLHSPDAADDLYLYRGADELVKERPILTGDVFAGLQIPGVAEADGELAMIVAHPCSMRRGAQLAPRILMAPVGRHRQISWRGSLNLMPLPELTPDTNFAARLSDLGQVAAQELHRDARVACLSHDGIAILHQRLICSLTRLVVGVPKLHDTAEPVLVEVELCEEWCLAACAAGVALAAAEASFEEWIRAEHNGRRRQDRLKARSEHSAIRRQLWAELKRRGWAAN